MLIYGFEPLLELQIRSVTYRVRRSWSRAPLLGFGSWFSASWKRLPSSYPSGFGGHGGLWDFKFCPSCSEVLLVRQHQPESTSTVRRSALHWSDFRIFQDCSGGTKGSGPLVVSPGAGRSAGAAGASSQLVINHLPEPIVCHLQNTQNTEMLRSTTQWFSRLFAAWLEAESVKYCSTSWPNETAAEMGCCSETQLSLGRLLGKLRRLNATQMF